MKRPFLLSKLVTLTFLFFIGTFSVAMSSPLPATSNSANSFSEFITVKAEAYENSGAMLGGFGTGFVELRPDGCFHDWAIFNRGRWAYRTREYDIDRDNRLMNGEMNADAMQFYIRTASEDSQPQVRRLGLKSDQTRVYNGFPWLHNVQAINYTAVFPGTTLEYVDDTLPIKVSGHFYSCVVPHDLRLSGTPGFFMEFTIKNISDKTQEVALATYLRNPLARRATTKDSASERKLQTKVTKEDDITYLTMETGASEPYKSSVGSLCLSTTGDSSWIAADFRRYLLGEIINPKGWGNRYHHPLLDIRDNGRLTKSDQQEYPGNIVPSDAEIEKFVDSLSDEQVGEMIQKIHKIPSLNSFLKTIELTGPPKAAALEGTEVGVADSSKLEETHNERILLKVLPRILDIYAGTDRGGYEWGDSMLCSTIKVEPGQEKKIKMVFSWYFPNHESPSGDRNMGHMYNNWFSDAKQVNKFLTSEYNNITPRIKNFIEVMRNNNLPPVLKFSASTQLFTMTGMTWWTQNNKIGIWEGHGAIGFNTMDVMYSTTHPIIALFPQFQQTWILNSNQWRDEKSGRLYHSLTDMDKGGKHHGWGYVDVNSSFVMQCIRDYLWTGDINFLRQIWPGIVASMNVLISMDSDNDGLPDQNTEKNWYDTFEMRGIPGCLSGVWISMLRGGIVLAEDIGDSENLEKWKEILPKAIENFEKKVYNGEYYSVWVDGELREEACMSDQLSGEFYARLIGLGNALPIERIHQVQKTIYKYNFNPEHGLLNGSYPSGRKQQLPIYQNIQLDGTWSGFEYSYAASLIDQGFVEMGLDVIEAIHFRYARAGRRWNHHECGDHYSRPLSIWASILAVTGFKIDAPNLTLTIAPKVTDSVFTAPWVSSTALGRFTRTSNTFTIECIDGAMELQIFKTNVPVQKAWLDGKAISCQVSKEDNLTVVKFDRPVKVSSGMMFRFD